LVFGDNEDAAIAVLLNCRAQESGNSDAAFAVNRVQRVSPE
jgi:hypothetical protein